MPELPEVETMRRGVAAVIGCRIVAAGRAKCKRRPIRVAPGGASFQRRVVGTTISDVDRVGKRVVLRLDSGEAIVIEPRMTGLVLLADPPTVEHLRFRFELRRGAAEPFELLYWDRRGLGSVELFTPRGFARAFAADRIGPDPLGMSCDELQERLERTRRAVKVALLDQRAVAGIGNLYASEILHLARLHPQRRCDLLRRREWLALFDAMQEVLLAAIRHEGSTLGDGTYRNALNVAGRYQNYHRVYGRAGEACGSCAKAKIVRTVLAQRSTFFCPRCQALRENR